MEGGKGTLGREGKDIEGTSGESEGKGENETCTGCRGGDGGGSCYSRVELELLADNGVA